MCETVQNLFILRQNEVTRRPSTNAIVTVPTPPCGIVSCGASHPRREFARMNLEVIEVLALTGEGVSGQHWSRNAARPRYSLSKSEVREAKFTHRFTCFHVAERVEADHDVLFAGRVSHLDDLQNVCLLATIVVLY